LEHSFSNASRSNWRTNEHLFVEDLYVPYASTTTGRLIKSKSKANKQGIQYFFAHPILWSYFLGILVPEILLLFAVFPLFYVLFYPIQAVAAFFFNGPSGIFTAWVATMHQAAVATQILSQWFILPQPLAAMFETVCTDTGYFVSAWRL
jgi:hypothetical protein